MATYQFEGRGVRETNGGGQCLSCITTAKALVGVDLLDRSVPAAVSLAVNNSHTGAVELRPPIGVLILYIPGQDNTLDSAGNIDALYLHFLNFLTIRELIVSANQQVSAVFNIDRIITRHY